MNNVGDLKTFSINGTQTSGLAYCWSWWDGSVDTTSLPTVQKTLNMGGDPRFGGTLPVSVLVVDPLGQSHSYQTSITVNNPPQVVPGSATATPNGKIVSYDTLLQATVYDLEGDGLTFAWTKKGIALGAGSVAPAGFVDAVWNGTHVGVANGTTATFLYTVVGNTDIQLAVTDSKGGETLIDYPVYGFERSDVFFAPSVGPASQSGDASSQPVVSVGDNAAFSLFSSTGDRLLFSWGFWGTNGWTIPSSTNGTTETLPDGTVRNVVIKGTTGETPGDKLAQVTVFDLDHNTFVVLTVPVIVVSNAPPVAITYEITPQTPIAGQTVRFSADYSDPNNDLVITKWTFTSPAITLWGRRVYVDTSSLSSGGVVEGTLEVIDRLGATDSLNISVILG